MPTCSLKGKDYRLNAYGEMNIKNKYNNRFFDIQCKNKNKWFLTKLAFCFLILNFKDNLIISKNKIGHAFERTNEN